MDRPDTEAEHGGPDQRLNSICPVCGQPTSGMPPVALTPLSLHHRETSPVPRAVAFCSFACVAIALRDPDPYLAAATENRVAAPEHRSGPR